MKLVVELVGDPGRMGFAGHLRAAFVREGLSLSFAGRVGSREELDGAFFLARAVEQVLFDGWRSLSPGADRFDTIRGAWEALQGAASLGDALADELVLLLVAGDEGGLALAGAGLAATWLVEEEGLASVAPADHPLFTAPGLPMELPGVLQLPARPRSRIVGLPHHLEGDVPALDELDRRCGVRR